MSLEIDRQYPREPDPCIDRTRIDLQGPLESPLRFSHRGRGSRPVPPRPAEHHEIPRVGIDRIFLLDAAADILEELEVECPSESAGDLPLRFGEVPVLGLKPCSPNVRAAVGGDQLRIDVNLLAGPPHAAFEDIADTEVAPDLLHVDRFALVGERRAAGYYNASGNLRQVGCQIIGDRVGEIFLLRIVR